MLSKIDAELGVALTDDVFLGQQELDKLLNSLPTYPPQVSVAVVEPLILLGDQDDEEGEDLQAEFDAFGYSSYARIVAFFLHHYLNSRDAAKANSWALRHFQALALYAKDILYTPGAQSAVFGKNASKVDLEDIISKVDRLSAYLLVHLVDDGWFSRTIPHLSAGKAASSSDGMARLLDGLFYPRDGDNVRESRILHAILKHVLADVSKAEADQLLLLARSIEKKGEWPPRRL